MVEDLAMPEGRAGRVRRRGELGRARRLRSGGARRRRRSQATSSAASARPDTRRCTRRRGAGCRRRSFSRAWIRSSPICAIASTIARCRRARRPATCAASGRRRSACARASPSRWAASTRTTARSDRASRPARSSRSSARRRATARSRRSATRRRPFPASAASSTARSCRAILGIEAGQSAVGDILNWWVEGVCEGGDALHDELSREAARSAPGESGLLALDWNNGNRTILVDPKLTGLILGQTLHTTRAEIYRALIEATAFGARDDHRADS